VPCIVHRAPLSRRQEARVSIELPSIPASGNQQPNPSTEKKTPNGDTIGVFLECRVGIAHQNPWLECHFQFVEERVCVIDISCSGCRFPQVACAQECGLDLVDQVIHQLDLAADVILHTVVIVNIVP